MKYLGFPLVGLLLSGCVVHQVPVAAPVAAADPATSQPPQNCREFQDTVTVGGTQQRAYGTTCQQADGSWHIVAPATTDTNPPPAVASTPVAVPAYPVYPAYPYYYPYYGYPAYYGPSVGVGFRFSGHWH
jgi:hypothetical protein